MRSAQTVTIHFPHASCYVGHPLVPSPSVVLLSLVLLVVSACSSDSAPASKAAGKPGGAPAARVKVAIARAGSLDSKVRFFGNVESALSTPIAAALAGTVDSVSVREGDAVAKGAVMLQLDARRTRADVRAAEALSKRSAAQLEQARRQAERVNKSSAALSAPERERYSLDVAVLEAQLAGEQATAQRVRVDLSRHRIEAPFSGVVKSRAVNPGAWVKAGDTVIELVSIKELQILVDIPFESGRGLNVGAPANILSGEFSAEAIIAGIVPALDASTRAMRIRVELADGVSPPAWLVPGLPVNVEFNLTLSGAGVLLPRDALIRGAVGTRIVKVVDGIGQPTPVQLLGATADEVLVQGEGLVAGDSVMTRGNERYRPGTKVIVE
jgi:RND family efflux transporter MFP subunit